MVQIVIVPQVISRCCACNTHPTGRLPPAAPQAGRPVQSPAQGAFGSILLCYRCSDNICLLLSREYHDQLVVETDVFDCIAVIAQVLKIWILRVHIV